jgi:hypothetical protein
MPAIPSYDYAFIRVVPRVEREEYLNVGVILFCRESGFLGALIHLDEEYLQALAPGLDLADLHLRLERIVRISEGHADAGPIAKLSQSERFHWLVSPRSTIIQTSDVHTGLCTDPQQALQHLLATTVRHS